MLHMRQCGSRQPCFKQHRFIGQTDIAALYGLFKPRFHLLHYNFFRFGISLMPGGISKRIIQNQYVEFHCPDQRATGITQGSIKFMLCILAENAVMCLTICSGRAVTGSLKAVQLKRQYLVHAVTFLRQFPPCHACQMALFQLVSNDSLFVFLLITIHYCSLKRKR